MAEYRRSYKIRIYIRVLSALSFIPEHRVRRMYYIVRGSVDFPVLLSSIYNYLYKNYIGDIGQSVRYPIHVWNVYLNIFDNIPSTNNEIKG
ncbi:hypothetical protein A3Q56_02417 [Intoshia linei]|uniref:Uncharacterized protein n=1 Tax=Intoshia linei TaxID=1819745 RepID=A0A177B883_9BILA|nr:hypothetical protein A3Q56_02417 [Intoshia linei]